MDEPQPRDPRDETAPLPAAGSNAGWLQLKALVADALERPAAEREGFLLASCPDDADLRAQARVLLEAHDDATAEFLGGATASPLRLGAMADAGPEQWVGREIGGFLVESCVASGGMGTVFRARQERTGQTVALKIVRPGLGSEAWYQRFDHEVRILAKLQHTAIARIFDAGVHEEGNQPPMPYFAMEFVDGLPLTQFIRERKLTVRQIVQVLVRVCEGVHHAHQRGIIHRDLKPDNILVTAQTGGDATRSDTELADIGQPKIVDFGIARATDAEQLITTQLTQLGQMIGTMAYMSPEQTTGNPDDIDIRSDVYSLGVILYEALSGQKPYRFEGVSLPEAARIVQETVPTKLGLLSRELAGDLEVIVGVALEKERERRYPSVFELAADLRRYLNDEPITARPPSTLYQIKKFARRNRGLVAGMAVALVALVAGATGTIWGWLDALEQSRRAKNAAAAAQRAETEAKSDRDQAIRSERSTKEAMKFLFGVLETGDVGIAGRNMTIRDLLDANADKIDGLFASRPWLQAELHSAFGWNYYTLGDYERGRQHMQKAFDLNAEHRGRTSEQTIADGTRLAEILIACDRLAEAEALIVENKALALQHLEQGHTFTLHAQSIHARVCEAQRKFDEAERLFRQVIAGQKARLGLNHDFTLSSINGLGNLLMQTGDYKEAAASFRQVFEVREELQGLQHTSTLVALINWAQALGDQGQSQEAVNKLEVAVREGEKVWSANHPDLVTAYGSLAVAYSANGQRERAAGIEQRLYDDLVAAGQGDTLSAATRLNNLIVTLVEMKRFDEAAPKVEVLIATLTKVRGADDVETSRAKAYRALVLAERMKGMDPVARLAALRRCREIYEEVIEIQSRKVGRRNPMTIATRNNYGGFLREHVPADAVPVLQEVVKDWAEAVPDAPQVLRLLRVSLAKTLRKLQRFAEAEAQFTLAWKLPEHLKASDREVASQAARLYELWGKPEQAKLWRQREKDAKN